MKGSFRPRTLEELKVCIECPWWVLVNLMTIKPKSGGVVKFVPNAVQIAIYRAYWWLNNILKSRQHGVSTFWVLFFLVRLLIERDKTAGVIDITENDAKKKLGMAKTAYDNLDNPEVHSETWEMENEAGEVATVAMWEIGAKLKAAVRMTKGRDAPFPQELVFSNGSSFYAGVSFRGGTLQYGLFTEFGKIAIKDPPKAAEIVEGAENAMHEGSIGVFETTMEGGQTGLAYERCVAAMKNPRENEQLTRLDQKFMFFGWYLDPANALSDEQAKLAMIRLADTPEVEARGAKWNWQTYFYGGIAISGQKVVGITTRLKDQGVILTPNQIAWYVNKRKSQGWAMLKEHPTFPEEAFQAPVVGAIYAEAILRAESEERVSEFSPHKGKLIHTIHDIGSNRNWVTWYVQKVGPEYWVVDCDHDLPVDMTIGERVGIMQSKGYNLGSCILPHDAAQAKIGNITTADTMKAAGMMNVKTLPVVQSVTLRIDGLHTLLPNFRFREAATKKGREMLKLYRYKQDSKTSHITDVIASDESNHYADSLGYIWEAEQASFFQEAIASGGSGPAIQRRPVRAGML